MLYHLSDFLINSVLMFRFSENKSHNEKPQGTHQDGHHQARTRQKRGSTNRSSKRPPRDGGTNTVDSHSFQKVSSNMKILKELAKLAVLKLGLGDEECILVTVCEELRCMEEAIRADMTG